MRSITFTISDEEIKNVAKRDLSTEQINSILTMVRCDEMLWKDINNSIIGAINELE